MKAALKKESEIKKEEIHEIKHEKDDIEDTDEHQSGSENESGDSTDDENDELQIINGKTVEKKSKKKKSKLTPEELKKKLELEEVSYLKKSLYVTSDMLADKMEFTPVEQHIYFFLARDLSLLFFRQLLFHTIYL